MSPCDATLQLFLHGFLGLTQDMQEGPLGLELGLGLGLELGLDLGLGLWLGLGLG